jgi:DNA repair protein RecO (recombination protein O)
MKVLLQPAYVLHHRLYRETSQLLEVFTMDYGRVSLVARGVRSGRSKLRSILQPFQPLLLSFNGKSDLKTLTAAEAPTPPLSLKGDCLLSAFYLNELLIKLLQKEDPYPGLYAIYQNALLGLQGLPLNLQILRLFEKKFLEEIGYGVSLKEDFLSKKPVVEDFFYEFIPEYGVKYVTAAPHKFLGKSLIAIANEQFETLEILQDAKRLMRIIFNHLLGAESLNSRKLFS